MTTSADAQTFARALYEVLISTVLKQLRAVAPKLEDISGEEEDVQKRIRAAVPTGTSTEVRNFLMTLAQEGALDQLPEVIRTFERYVSEAGSSMLDAEVTSAVPLSAAQQEHITAQLRTRYDQPLAITFHVDETLIGGLIIRVGDQVLDNSLRVRLNTIQRNMLAS